MINKKTSGLRNHRFSEWNKSILFLSLFLFLISQNAFSGELITLTSPEKINQPGLSKVTSSDFSSTKFGNDVVGFGADNRWRIRPGFEFRTIYDSNVNQEPPHRRDEDIIFSYRPSVDLVRIGNRLEVNGGYEMNFEEYLRNPDQSAFNHAAKANVQFKGERLKVNVSDKFSLSNAYATSEQSERRRFVTNDVRPEVAYRLTPKVSIAALYENYILHYKESAVREDSYTLHDFGGRIYYHATPKLDFYLHGSGTVIDYYRAELLDSNGFSTLVGAVGRATSKLLIDLQTGFRGHYYDDSAINSFNGWVAQGVVQYKITPKLNGSLILKREKQESVYRNVGWYEANMLGARFNYRLASRIVLEMDSSIQSNSYPRETTEGTRTKKRDDFISSAGAKIKWNPVRHLIFSVGYDFRERASNFDNLFDYVDHVLESSVSYKLS